MGPIKLYFMGVKVAKSSTWSNLSNSISHRECKHKMDATVLKIRVDRVVKNIAAYIMLGITPDFITFSKSWKKHS